MTADVLGDEENLGLRGQALLLAVYPLAISC